MPTGAFTDDIDLIQVLLVAFVLFFAGLVIYLRREDKREGYPLEPTTGTRTYLPVGWPAPPPPKVFRLMDGGSAVMPHVKPQVPIEDVPPPAMGEPLPFGRPPLLAGLGAGAFVVRSDLPMRNAWDELLLQPLRDAPGWTLGRGETDPRGRRVLGRGFGPVGIVRDLWIDRGARILRYLEIELDPAEGAGTILVPVFHCRIARRDTVVVVRALREGQFGHVPRLARAGEMTAREEDRINAFYAGGTIYADASA